MREFMIALVNTSVTAGICTAVFLLIFSFLGKQYGAKCKKVIWCLIAVCCLIPFRFPASVPGYRVEVPDVVLRKGNAMDTESADVQSGSAADVSQTAPEESQGTRNPVVSGSTKRELTATDMLFVLWACAAAALLVYYAAGYWIWKRNMMRRGQECWNIKTLKILKEEVDRYKIKAFPRLFLLQDSSIGPFTMGVFQNTIVLPEDISDERELRFILKHELLHCKQKDILWKLLFVCVNIIHWFNPLIWVLRKAAEQEIEICCDEAVVAGEDRAYREEYSDMIMSWVAKGGCKWSAASTGYVQEVKFIKRRFDSIINGRKKKGVFLIVSACAALLLAGSLIHIQNGKKVYAVSQVPIDAGIEIRTDLDGDESEAAKESGEAKKGEEAKGNGETKESGDAKASEAAKESGETKESGEVQDLRQRMEDFCQAYFHGDAEAAKGFLSASYSGDIEVYGNPEEAETMDMRDIAGLDGIGELSDTERYTLSKPFLVPGEDSLTYLSVTFVSENGEWKISGYGLEK